MSIIPASRLSRSDLSRLGNNLVRSKRRVIRPGRRLLAAVNRSLAGIGEQVGRLHTPLLTASAAS